VRIEGLDKTITDTLLLIHLKNGDEESRVLTPGQPTMTIDAHAGAAVPADLLLGIEHILTGVDHLLFVFGLLLLSSGWRDRRARSPPSPLRTRSRSRSPHSRSWCSIPRWSKRWSLVDPVPRGRTGAQGAGAGPADPAPALGRRFRLRPAPPCAGLCRRAARDRPAAGQQPASLFLFNVGLKQAELAFVRRGHGPCWLLSRYMGRRRAAPCLMARRTPSVISSSGFSSGSMP